MTPPTQPADVLFDPERLLEALDRDAEFRLCARHWSGSLHLGAGERRISLVLDGGRVTRISTGRQDLAPGDVGIDAPDVAWRRFLQPIPPAFYHDLIAASIHHEFAISGDVETLYAYYPAIRRLFDVLRGVPDAPDPRTQKGV